VVAAVVARPLAAARAVAAAAFCRDPVFRLFSVPMPSQSALAARQALLHLQTPAVAPAEIALWQRWWLRLAVVEAAAERWTPEAVEVPAAARQTALR
jgi:hypothetical protein